MSIARTTRDDAALTQEAPRAGRNHLRGLVLNQTVGLAAAVCTVAVVVRSPTVRARLLRSALGSRVVGWLAEKTSTIAPADVRWAVCMMASMIGWTVLLQRVMAPGGEVSCAEWRPETARERLLASSLVASAAVVEELVFRGVLLPAGALVLEPVAGVVASALAFGLLHLDKGLVGQTVVAGYGMILGCGLLLGASLYACVIAHARVSAPAFFLPVTRGGAGRAAGPLG